MDPWEAEGTDESYFVPYTSLSRVENSVIDFDVENIRQVLPQRHSHTAPLVTQRVNTHYLNSTRHEKRAYGNGRVDDYQAYNWGLALSVEMGLIADQTELLMSFYCCTMEERLTEQEVETILILHTNFKSIPNQVSQQRKWRELKKSWKLLAVKHEGYPQTISKKDFMHLLDVNFIDFEVNIERLSRDMQSVDYDAAYLHMLLLDDPLIRGELPPTKKDFCLYPKSRRKKQRHQQQQPRGGDDDSSIALFNDLLREEEERREELGPTSEDIELTLEIQGKLDKRKANDEEAKQRKLEKLKETQMLRDSELARREFEETMVDDLAQRVQRIREERRAEKAGLRKKERAALVKATAKKSHVTREQQPVEVSLHAPNVSQAVELKPPPLAYRPPSPPLAVKQRQQSKSKEKRKAKEEKFSEKKSRLAEKSSSDEQPQVVQQVEEAKDETDEKIEETGEVPGAVDIQGEGEDFDYQPTMDDDEYFIGEMADASIFSLLDDLDFLDEYIRATIEPPPPTAEEEAEWKRQAILRKKEAERIKKEIAYVEGLCEEAADLCMDRVGEAVYGEGLEKWRHEDELTDYVMADLLNSLANDLMGTGTVEMYKQKQRHDMADAVTESIIDKKFELLYQTLCNQAARQQLTEELTHETFEAFFEPFIEGIVTDRVNLSITSKLDVDFTKSVMERKAREAEERKQELQRQKEEAAQRKKEAAEKKARQLAAKKEEDARLKAEKKQRDLARLEEIENKKQERKAAEERARRIAAGEIVEEDSVPSAGENSIGDNTRVDESNLVTPDIESQDKGVSHISEEDESVGLDGKNNDVADRHHNDDARLHESQNDDHSLADSFRPKSPCEMAENIERLLSVATEEVEDEIDRDNAEDDLFYIAYDIVSDGVAHALLLEAVREVAGDEVTPCSTSRLPVPPHEHDDYDFGHEDEFADLTVDMIEDAALDKLCDQVLKKLSQRLATGDEGEDVVEAVRALLSDKLHLDMQKLMSDTGSLPSFLEPPLTPVLFEVTDGVSQPSCFPSLEDLHSLPFTDYRFNVPKTNGQLRVHIRHDDDGESSGLFVHGFKSYSRAEEQGLLQVGDEVLEMNDVPMENKGLLDVIDAMEGHTDEFVTIVVRRHEVSGGLLSGTITPRFSEHIGGGGSSQNHMSNTAGSVESLGSSTGFRGLPNTSPRPFIVGKTQHPETFPPLESLLKLPSQEMRFLVPKTNGQLRIELRHDDDGETNGIFIQGFRPFSEAKKQGLLQIGDELLELEGVDVCGRQLEDVINVLAHHYGDDVEMVVCRRADLKDLDKCAEYFSQPGTSRRGSDVTISLRLTSGGKQPADLQWEDIEIDNDSQSTEQPHGLFVGEHGFSISSCGGSLQDSEDNGSLAASTNGLPDGDVMYTSELQSVGSQASVSGARQVKNENPDNDKILEVKKTSPRVSQVQATTKSSVQSVDVENTVPKPKALEHSGVSAEKEEVKQDLPKPSGFRRFFAKKASTTSAPAEVIPDSLSGPSSSDVVTPISSPPVVISPVPDSKSSTPQSERTTKKVSMKAAAKKARNSIQIIKLSDPLVRNSFVDPKSPARVTHTNISAPSTARTNKSVAPDMESFTKEVEVDAPRTEDQLRIMIKRFNDGESRGFYVHGFQPMCNAEGILLAGDVILEIDGQSVAGASLKGVARIIGGVEGPIVRFKVKRTVTLQKE